jgi:hypothetical protein
MPDFKNILKDAMTGSTQIESESGVTKQRAYQYLQDNVLHKYASFNYLFTLSALSRAECNDPTLIIKNAPHDIIARSGGIGDNQKFSNPNFSNDSIFTNTIQINKALQAQTVLEKNRDIYFERVEIDSRPWFNQERKLMNFTKVEISMSEPNGITLWQKIRGAAANNEFINHQNAPFLLTIEFKGYDSKGNPVPDSTVIRFLPVYLTQSTMRLNAGGATYTLTGAPWKDFAKNNAFLFTRGTGEITGDGTGVAEYLRSFAKSLNKNMEQETKETATSPAIRQYPDTYIITADPAIGRGKTADYSNTFESEFFDNLGELGFGKKKLKSGVYKAGMSISKILEDFVKQFDQYSDIAKIVANYWKEVESMGDFGEMPAPWVPWFKIDCTVTVHPEFDKILKSHRRTIHYHIKPFLIHVANFARAGLGGFTSWTEYVRKRYDYIYTGKNLDILDLDITYESSYALARLIDNQESTVGSKIKSAFYKIVDYFGAKTFPEQDLPLSEFPTNSRSEYDSIFKLDNQAQIQQFYDFLTNPQGDMVRVDMKIMGDPAFIGQDCFLPLPTPPSSGNYNALDQVASINGIEWDSKIGAFNFDNAETFVKLNFIFPDDFDEKTGLYNFNKGETPQFSGLYRVNSVQSVFENGQFTQILGMSRYMNQDNPSNVILRETKQKGPAGADAQTGGWDEAVNTGGDSA